MSNATDMSTPVTRGELRDELERFATKADLERFATKADLEIWGGALADRIAQSHRELSAELAKRIAQSHRELSAELAKRIADSHGTLSAELAGHAKTLLEMTSREISAFDDKYKRLPARVKRLEARLGAGRPKRP